MSMSYYFIIYVFSIVLSIIGWVLIFQRYKNISGFFFLLFTILLSIWFCTYFLFFSGIENTNILLYLSRSAFGTSIIGIYSLLFFIKNFQQAKEKILTRRTIFILFSFILLLLIFIFTPAIVSDLQYDSVNNVYREIYGNAYIVHIIFSILFVPLFAFYSIKQLKFQSYLNRIRLKNILFSAFILVICGLTLQLILPLFWIWIFEKELIFLFLFFVLFVLYTVKRYYFSSLEYGIGKIFIAYLSIILSIISINTISFLYLHFKTGPINNYWMFQDHYSIIDTIVWVMVFYISYTYLHKFFLGNHLLIELKKSVQKLEQNISYLTSFPELERYLSMEMKRVFKTNFCVLKMFHALDEKNEIQRYFENNLTDKIFINDVVFIEEKKNKFDRDQLLNELPEETFLVLPIFDTDGLVNMGVFIVGAKSFGDFYTINEINILREFITFLELHIKYIKTYQLLQDFSMNLDKKVDEKTIEYNILVNKQKEFISILSHEIKAPIANAIFQADSIIDDIENANISRDTIKEELVILNGELLKTGDLTTRLFSMQYFDTRSVELFKERIQITTLMKREFEIYARMHEDITFIDLIDVNMWFMKLDKIQFHQVLTNLLQNAIKFLDKKESIIIVEAYIQDGIFYMNIEDNGRGFHGINTEHLFDRYSTGSGESIWLGMGLYLCKKIVDMHGGNITADISNRLGWARFSIQIPLN